MQNPEIVIIGAAIIDVLAYPVNVKVFETGSYSTEDIHMTTGADALNEATILAKKGRRVQLETVIGQDDAGKFIQAHCNDAGIMVRDACIKKDEKTGMNIVLVEQDGTRSFLTNPHGTLRSLKVEHIQMPFPESAKIVCFASIFVFPKIGPDKLVQIFSQAKMQGKIVCADMTKRKKGETLEDMAEALVYIRKNAEALGVDPSGYAVMGSSAGARMAAWIGNLGVEPFGYEHVPKPAAVLMAYTGLSDASADDPPTFMVQGTDDWIAPVRVVDRRMQTLKALGVPTDYMRVEGIGHGFGIGDGTPAAVWIDRAAAFWSTMRHQG